LNEIFHSYYFLIVTFHEVVNVHLRCGGIVRDHVIARLLLSPLVMEEFWKSVNIWQSYG